MAANVRLDDATNDTPVPNGETKASIYSNTDSQWIPSKIAKSANGDAKFMPCQPLAAIMSGFKAVMKVLWSKIYNTPLISSE